MIGSVIDFFGIKYFIRINTNFALMYIFFAFSACWRMTVDGGTDRWFDFVEKNSLSLPLPNYVTGDFDSVRPKTLDFCKQREEITIKNTPDQNYTDFHKALQILTETCPYKVCIFPPYNIISFIFLLFFCSL